MVFCPRLMECDPYYLVPHCPICTRYFVACCPHKSWTDNQTFPCHHYKLVFVDGACSNNGREDAKAGIGLFMGEDEEYSWSITVDDTMDPNAIRTSQRAELLAALYGLEKLVEQDNSEEIQAGRHKHLRKLFMMHSPEEARARADLELSPSYVIATDSEYVVNGMLHWLDEWKVEGWRTKQGKRPRNLDLFLRLDRAISKLEGEGKKVGFWWIPRESNEAADRLAKRAARV
ncbi:ribonuclease H-like protein [Hymenopellis radicata]|nr:ribonuclease H-like protein [Hymenopellis radicata]